MGGRVIITRIVQAVLVVAAVAGLAQMARAARRGAFLAVFMTARLTMMLHGSDIPLFEAGQTSAPVCLSSYDCEAMK